MKTINKHGQTFLFKIFKIIPKHSQILETYPTIQGVKIPQKIQDILTDVFRSFLKKLGFDLKQIKDY